MCKVQKACFQGGRYSFRLLQKHTSYILGFLVPYQEGIHNGLTLKLHQQQSKNNNYGRQLWNHKLDDCKESVFKYTRPRLANPPVHSLSLIKESVFSTLANILQNTHPCAHSNKYN